MFIILIIVIIILIIQYLAYMHKENFKNICNSKLTDREFLEHMIPHHQVAIDISKILQKKSESIELQKICRDIILIQEIEIKIMHQMLYSLPDRISDSTIKMNKTYQPTLSDFIKPNKLGLTNTYCDRLPDGKREASPDPSFFDSNKHIKHLFHITDDTYIEHMIPHHQVAVDMSKILLKNTDNDMMISFAYRIIKGQQNEVIILDNLKKSSYKNKSNLIL
jgi:uncharacterized protein (DUF305 family)